MKILGLSKFNQNVEAMTRKASGLIDSRFGLWFLGLLSFVESALVIPIVTDPFMVAYIMVHRTRAMVAVLVTTLSSVFGGFVAYVTAAFMIDLMQKLSPGTIAAFNQMIENYRDDTFILGLLGALTPIPFTITALVAGTIKGNLIFFLLGAFVGRLLRYGVVGYLTYRFGERVLGLARKNIVFSSIVTIILIAIYAWYKM